MKWYIRFLSILLWLTFYSSSFAAGVIDKFEVILWKSEANIWEALDITITAVDSNDEIVEDYTWDILVFSESDNEAEFPNDLSENSYTFTNANEWSVKFENAVKFNNSWVQDVYVYDLNDEDILGVAEITINEQETQTEAEITILSPETGITIGTNNITVSGSSKKNHQIQLVINGEQKIFTTTNADWIFEKEVDKLENGENTIQAYVLDSDNEKIWESEIVNLKINSNAPQLKSLSVTPNWEIEAQSKITIELISNAGLSSVRAIMNDVVTELIEWVDGVYSATTTAPSEEGEYGVDIILRSEFGNETQEREVETLTVISLNSGKDIEEIPVQVEDKIEKSEKPAELNLKITGIKVTELKTKSIITWDELPDARSYNIYKKISDTKIELLENVKVPRYEIFISGDKIQYDDFAIKAVGQTPAWEVVQWNLSEMTRVQTGPELYIFMFLIAMLLSGWVFFMRRSQV